jgi:hypothetical protein
VVRRLYRFGRDRGEFDHCSLDGLTTAQSYKAFFMSEEIELFQPSSGTHGEIFMSEYCYQCIKFPHDSDAKNQCQIVLATMAYDIQDPEYPKEWRYVDGQPTCTAFNSREEFNAERRLKRKASRVIAKDTDTIDLFGGEI